MSRFVYCYTMRNTPDRIREVVPRHVAYWHGLDLPEYLGGPFADRSGGLITFAAPDLSHAREAVHHDPFVTADLIEDSWVKEWRIE